MGAVTGIIVFLLIWWTALFVILPFGHARDTDGSVAKPQMKRKLIFTTALSIVLWLLIFVLIEMDIISFREIADQMIVEDLQ